MNPDAIDRLVATIDELERLFARAKDNPLAEEWGEMQSASRGSAGTHRAIASALVIPASYGSLPESLPQLVNLIPERNDLLGLSWANSFARPSIHW